MEETFILVLTSGSMADCKNMFTEISINSTVTLFYQCRPPPFVSRCVCVVAIHTLHVKNVDFRKFHDSDLFNGTLGMLVLILMYLGGIFVYICSYTLNTLSTSLGKY